MVNFYGKSEELDVYRDLVKFVVSVVERKHTLAGLEDPTFGQVLAVVDDLGLKTSDL